MATTNQKTIKVVQQRKMKNFEVVPYHDFNRRTCLLVKSGEQCKFIPLNTTGLRIHSLSNSEFGEIYTPMPQYPIAKAVQIYVNYAKTVGASKEVLKFLGQFVNVSQKEHDMATKKAAATEAVEKPAKAEPKAKATTAKATTAKATFEKKPSAAQRFQELIMLGQLTDSQIFSVVQKEFGLDDSKRSYVKWYRNHLIKRGLNPPAAK